jgi:hypothetical protein
MQKAAHLMRLLHFSDLGGQLTTTADEQTVRSKETPLLLSE